MGWSITLGRIGVQTDAALIARCQRADVAAFNEIVARYKGKIYSYILRMTGNAEDAEDLTQEVFVKMYTSIHSFRAEASLSTWLFRIAGNLCVDAFRRKKIRPTALSLDAGLGEDENEGLEVCDNELAPERLLHRKELAGRIEAAIASLPPKLRSAIVLHDVEGMSYEEISAVENIPLGTVKSRIFNGRVALRESLRPYLEA
jgi:RNA polymerase sigma-70 factor (ECF subfamily)